MKFTKLEDEQREFFNRSGYLVIRNALDSDMLKLVTAACDRVVERRCDEPSGRISLVNVLPEDEIFMPLLTWETTVPLVVQLLSFNLRLAKSHLIYKYPDPPETKPSTNWHRDFRESPFDMGPHRCVRLLIKVVYQLSDTTKPLSGNTMLAPGSNTLTRPLEIPAEQNDPENAIELQLKAGDAFLFENRTYHRIGLNRTKVPRKCLMMGYSYSWITPLDYDVQPDWLVEKVKDPIRRQLVGGSKMSSTEVDPWALRKWADQHGLQRAAEIEFEHLTT